MQALKMLLRECDDPYAIITLAGDTAAFQLAAEIVPHLSSTDPMVRWNAAGVLFTRLRDVHSAKLCADLLDRETDNMVLGIALAGAGELLPLLDDRELRDRLAQKLWLVFCGAADGLSQAEEWIKEQMRSDAYRGIEAAVGIPPLDRATATRDLDMATDIKQEVVNKFRQTYAV